MPFEPLQTDEKLDVAVKRPDIDAPLIRGCMIFSVVAILVLGLTVAPFFLIDGLNTWSALMRACLFAAVPSFLCGVIAARVAGAAGGSAFVAGALMGAVFLYLKLRLIGADEAEPVQYADHWSYVIPAVWIILALIAAFAAIPKHDLSTAMTMRPESEDN